MKNKEEHRKEKKQHKRWSVWKSILIGAGVVLAIFIIIVIFSNIDSSQQSYSSGGSQQEASRGRDCKTVSTPYQEQEEYMKTEYYTETVPYTDQECDTKDLVYSITNFNFDSSVCNQKIEECVDYTLGFCTKKITYCTDKTVRCSLSLKNLDSERGTWGIGFRFYETGTSSVAASNSESVFIYPSSSETVTGVGRITTKEPYEQSYSCDYYVSDEPTKQVCRDVIKYKELQRSRQVTAYRPVTKYRTETVCD